MREIAVILLWLTFDDIVILENVDISHADFIVLLLPDVPVRCSRSVSAPWTTAQRKEVHSVGQILTQLFSDLQSMNLNGLTRMTLYEHCFT